MEFFVLFLKRNKNGEWSHCYLDKLKEVMFSSDVNPRDGNIQKQNHVRGSLRQWIRSDTVCVRSSVINLVSLSLSAHPFCNCCPTGGLHISQSTCACSSESNTHKPWSFDIKNARQDESGDLVNKQKSRWLVSLIRYWRSEDASEATDGLRLLILWNGTKHIMRE
jgi:hypothetical protein